MSNLEIIETCTGRPNIFDYAKKELSMDAMICFILRCATSSDKDLKQFGVDFIKSIFFPKDKTEGKTIELLFLEKQYNQMDIYTIIQFDGTIYPIIIEDKTNTFLHDDQMKTYIEKVQGWHTGDYLNENYSKIAAKYGVPKKPQDICIKFVLIKTGYTTKWDEFYYKKKQSEIDVSSPKVEFSDITKISSLVTFFEKHQALLKKYHILEDYYLYLIDENKFQIEAESNWKGGASDKEKIKESFWALIGQICFFEETFKQTEAFPLYTVNNAFLTYDVFENADETKDIRYFFRIKTYKKDNDDYEFYLQLRQYRDEKKHLNEAQDAEWHAYRKEDFNFIKRRCKKAILDNPGLFKEEILNDWKDPGDGKRKPNERVILSYKFFGPGTKEISESMKQFFASLISQRDENGIETFQRKNKNLDSWYGIYDYNLQIQ